MANKDEILAYVRKTPANTNVNVLGTMLDGTGEDSNDFGIANVNIRLNMQYPHANVINIDENYGLIPSISETGTYKVVLYQGHNLMAIPSGSGISVSATGDITIDNEAGIIDIFGDGALFVQQSI